MDWNHLKKQAEQQPVNALAAAALAVTAIAKLVDASSAARSRRAYTRQVNYRIKHRK